METEILRRWLEELARGEGDPEEVLRRILGLPLLPEGEGPPALRLDTGRELRTGIPEVVFAPGKEDAEILEAARNLLATHGRVLVTRLQRERGEALAARLPGARWNPRARTLRAGEAPAAAGSGRVEILAAGTSDLAVAEEARETLAFLGLASVLHADVGVAGLARLLELLPELRSAEVLIVCAGMEGALASVASGLLPAPVIAVPTGVGYGASWGGLAALLAMLNSCAPGVTVVNIGNGFGAAVAAARILRRVRSGEAGDM